MSGIQNNSANKKKNTPIPTRGLEYSFWEVRVLFGSYSTVRKLGKIGNSFCKVQGRVQKKATRHKSGSSQPFVMSSSMFWH